MNHRKWTPGALMAKAYRDIAEEHNATVDAWQQAAADVERLAAANGDLCDELAGLRGGPGLAGSVPFGTDETPEQIEIRQLKQEAHYDHTAAAERIAELEKQLSDCQWRCARAERALNGAGFMNNGDDEWMPPIGKAPAPIRVPFSDVQIHTMATACSEAWAGGSTMPNAIRAALAAGGLEPCPVPEYAPEDVAFSTERASDEELGRIGYEASPSMSVADTPITWMGGLFESHRKQHCIRAAAVRARVEAPLLAEIERLKSEPAGRDVAGLRAKIENQRMSLRQLHEARERDAVERMKLESEFVSVTAERDKAIRESGNRTGEVLQLRAEVEAVKAERDGLKARNDIQAGQLRHIDGEISPLMSEVAALESELAAVKAQRDNYKSMLEEEVAAGSEYLERAEAMGCPKDGNINDAYAWALAELAALSAEVEAVKAERDGLKADIAAIFDLTAQDGADSALEAVRKLKEYTDTIEWRESHTESAHKSLLDERDTLRAELAAVKAERDGLQAKHIESLEGFKQMRDHLCATNEKLDAAKSELAALRQRDAVPVDPDAWKTDLVVAWLKFREAGRQIILVDNTQAMGALGSLSAIDAARAAQWLASYAAAHGCPAQHAVIDVPAGVPSVDELADDGDQQPENNCPVCDGTGHVADTEDGPVIADCPVCDQTLPFYSFINGFPVCPQCGFSDAPVPTPAPTDEQVEAPEKRDAVPVKVRFSCTAKELANVMRGRVRFEDCAQEAMDYLTSHAVIDAPAGVPSVDELVTIGTAAWHKAGGSDPAFMPVPDPGDYAYATAIRDAVLAGVAGEEDYCKMSEGLVKALSDYGLLVTQNRKYEYSLRPINAAPTPPPTAEQVEALAGVLREGVTCPVCSGHTNDDDRGCCCERTLARAAYAHIGRVPVGAELDVTWQEMLSIWSSNTSSKDGMEAILDLCRSRIKPVYECKECSDLQLELEHVKTNLAECEHRIDLAKSALEGE